MDSINNQQAYWNRVAQSKTFTHPINSIWLKQYFTVDDVLVDFGCGYGRLVVELQQAGFLQVKGYDTSIELIKRGTTTHSLPLFHIESPDALPIEDASVDGIFLFAVLTCIPGNAAQEALIALLFSKLKPGAKLYISDYLLQENQDEVGRYEYLNDDPDNYGVFSLPEGATFRHHTRDRFSTLLQPFTILEEQLVEVFTMNGHKAMACQFLVQKPFA